MIETLSHLNVVYCFRAPEIRSNPQTQNEETITNHGRLFVDICLLPTCVLKSGDLSMQCGRGPLDPLVMSAPKNGCISYIIACGAVEDECSTDGDPPFLVTLSCLGERSRKSELVEVVQCWICREGDAMINILVDGFIAVS